MCLKTKKKSQNMADNRTAHAVNGNKDTTAQPHVTAHPHVTIAKL